MFIYLQQLSIEHLLVHANNYHFFYFEKEKSVKGKCNYQQEKIFLRHLYRLISSYISISMFDKFF